MKGIENILETVCMCTNHPLDSEAGETSCSRLSGQQKELIHASSRLADVLKHFLNCKI
jgi:hypothetical protein